MLPPKKKVVDDYVIILACVLGGLLVLPLLAWVGRRAWLARQHRKVWGRGLCMGGGNSERSAAPGWLLRLGLLLPLIVVGATAVGCS